MKKILTNILYALLFFFWLWPWMFLLVAALVYMLTGVNLIGSFTQGRLMLFCLWPIIRIVAALTE